jgi:hypothetical protein
MRYLSSLFVAIAFVWAFALAPREARAQTIGTTLSVTGILGAVQRCEHVNGACDSADNSGNHPHPNGVLVNALNFEDCSAQLHYEFQLVIQYPSSSYQLEAWVGTQDCSQLTNRQTSATAVCWPVAPFQQAVINPFLLDVGMRDIASGAFTTTHPTTFTPTTDPAVCQSQTQTGATIVTLYIFFVDGGSNPVGTVQQYPITLDMRAGDVQGSITAGVGDTVLIVGIPSTTDPDTQGWNVYCDPPPGQESTVGTSSVDAASNNGLCPAPVPDSSTAGPSDALATDAVSGVTDSSTTDSAADSATPPGSPAFDDAGGNACGVSLNEAGVPSLGGCAASSVLVAGGGTSTSTTTDDAGNTIFVEGGTSSVTNEEGGASFFGNGKMDPTLQYGQPNGQRLLCASSSGTSTSLNVKNLKDGVFYNIAVAAVDGVGNVGPLSNVACGEPVPVADFWRLYYDAGGRAGGGFCSADGVGVPAGTSGLGVLMLASMVAMARRRRRS